MAPGRGGGLPGRRDEPIRADPTTGFHPDQLTSYPLQRVGSRLYVAHIEAVAGTEYDHDTVLIDSNQMDAYPSWDPTADDFLDVPIEYTALDAPERRGTPEAPYRGRGELIIEDFNEYGSETPHHDFVEENGVVSVLLTRPREDGGLDEVRRKLDRGRLSVRVTGDGAEPERAT